MNRNVIWEKSGQDADRLRRNIILALMQSGVCVLLEDDNRNYVFIANLQEGWHLDDNEPPRDRTLFGKDIAALIAPLKQEVRESGEERRIEVAPRTDKCFEFVFKAVRSSNGGTLDVMTTIIDLSEERQRQKALRALLREVSHRSKNLLSIIQSLAAQTARHSGTVEQFLRKFQGRVFSLSHSQDLITDSSWRGAFFRDLVRDQTTKYLPEDRELVAIEGDNLLLPPNVSMHIGLALHELVVNAVTHGALAAGERPVAVECRKVPAVAGAGDEIEITWNERLKDARFRDDDELIVDPHFGSVVLETIVPGSVNGTGDYEITAGRIRYRLVFPVQDNF